MDTYREMALGVESAWPVFVRGQGKPANKMRSRIAAVIGVALAVVGLALLAGCGKPQAQPAAPPLEVSVVEVQPAPVTVYNEYVAQTQAPDTIEIRSQVTGLLERQAFADGARVKKGELALRHRPAAVRGPARAGQGEPGAGRGEPGQRPAESARATRASSPQKAVSQQDYDTRRGAAGRASAALVQAQKAVLRNAELNLEFATLRAPRDGFMSSSQVKPGALITAQQTLLTTLYSTDPMWVYFTISEDQLARAAEEFKPRRGARARAAFYLRLPDGTEYAVTGRSSISSTPRSTRRAARCRCASRFPIPERLLRPGLFVRVIVAAFESPSAIRVPQQAVQELQGTRSRFMSSPKATRRRRGRSSRATASATTGSSTKGLAAGDRIVVEGIGNSAPRNAGRTAHAARRRCAKNRARRAQLLHRAAPVVLDGASRGLAVMILVGALAALSLPIAQYPAGGAAAGDRERRTSRAPTPRSSRSRWPPRSSSRSTARRTCST